MSGYNVRIRELRLEQGLSLKEASKKIGINRFSLFLYEAGYLRPSFKKLKKINDYFHSNITNHGTEAYPTPQAVKISKKYEKKRLFIKRIILGSLTTLMLGITIGGGVLFHQSVNNQDSYYGESYNELRESVSTRGTLGHDLVTNIEYYQVQYRTSTEETSIIFYKTDSLLYFSEFYYTVTATDDVMGLGRYHYRLGDNLGVNSYICQFTYGSASNGSFFSCDFVYTDGVVEDVNNFQIRVKGDESLDKDLAIRFVNQFVEDINGRLSHAISEEMSKDVDFYNDILPAREKGRIINFRLQTVGLFMILIGIVFFFIFGGFFTKLMCVNIKPRLVDVSIDQKGDDAKELPDDIKVPFVLSDIFVAIFARSLVVLSFIFMFLGFISKLGLFALPAFFHNTDFLSFLHICLLAGIFLNHFVVLGRHKKPAVLIKKIIFNAFLFLFIASLETTAVLITNAWGYNFASLIFSYLPGNIFQIVAVQYLVYLFLFFQPPFLNNKKKYVRYIWHSLSLIPLAFLISTYFISNAYYLTYGVKEDLFVNFWFPNGFLPLSIVSTAFMYTIFFLDLYLEKRFGTRKAQLFQYGNTYNLISNLICTFFIVVTGLIDLFFMKNQYAYYLGLGNNQWIFTLIPLIFLCRYTPNRRETIILDLESNDFLRNE